MDSGLCPCFSEAQSCDMCVRIKKLIEHSDDYHDALLKRGETQRGTLSDVCHTLGYLRASNRRAQILDNMLKDDFDVVGEEISAFQKYSISSFGVVDGFKCIIDKQDRKIKHLEDQLKRTNDRLNEVIQRLDVEVVPEPFNIHVLWLNDTQETVTVDKSDHVSDILRMLKSPVDYLVKQDGYRLACLMRIGDVLSDGETICAIVDPTYLTIKALQGQLAMVIDKMHEMEKKLKY